MPSIKTIRQTEFLPSVKPAQVYEVLLDGKKHSKMTGGKASDAGTIGAAFTAWDGYISGTTLELDPARRILQDWKTTEWPDGAAPSKVEWTFSEKDGGTEVTLVHSDVPVEQVESYRGGWVDYYWTPMKEYFAEQAG
jgi:activator of HSP90 ATPase